MSSSFLLLTLCPLSQRWVAESICQKCGEILESLRMGFLRPYVASSHARYPTDQISHRCDSTCMPSRLILYAATSVVRGFSARDVNRDHRSWKRTRCIVPLQSSIGGILGFLKRLTGLGRCTYCVRSTHSAHMAPFYQTFLRLPVMRLQQEVLFRRITDR